MSKSNGGWRASGGARPAASGSAGSRSWRQSRAPVVGGRGIRWMVWFQRGLAAAGCLLCVVLFIWLLKFLGRMSTEIVVLAVPEYTSDAVPLNACAGGDVAEFSQLATAKRAASSVNLTQLDSLDELAATKSADAVILYANVIGGVDDQGIFLLPRDATADDSQRFLRLDALFDGLKALKPKTDKLLILDIARAPIDWRLGQLTPPDLAALSGRVEDVPHLAMLAACRPGEQSWTTSALGPGQSVFGYYVAQGLAGTADADGDGKVNVSELFNYVQSNCVNWVLNNRDEQAQHPLLVPPPDQLNDRDFAIIRVGESLSSDHPPDESGSGWRDVDRVRDDLDRLNNRAAIAHLDPLALRDAEFLVDRAESALRAGQPKLAADLLRRAQDRIGQLQRVEDDPTQEIADDPFLVRNLGRFWESTTPHSGTPATPPAGGLPLPEDLLADQLRYFQATFPLAAPLPEDLLARVIEVRRLGEEAGAVPGGAIPWVRGRMKPIDQRRHTIEDRLFLNDVDAGSLRPELEAIAAEYQQVIADGQTIDAARRVADFISLDMLPLATWAAWREGDAAQRQRLLQMAATTEDFFASEGTPIAGELEGWISAAADSGQQLELQILRLFDLTRRLQHDLDAPDRGATDADAVTRLKATSDAVDRLATEIRTRLRTGADDLTRQISESPQPLHRRRIVEALRAPGLSPEARRRLNQTLRNYEDKMAARTKPASAGDAGPSSAANAGGLPEAQADGLWHGLWILQVMSLSGGDDWKPLAEDWRKAAGSSPDERQQRLIDLGERIRLAWGRMRQRVAELVARDVEFEDRRPLLVEADRASRVLYPSDISRLDPGLNPARTLYDYDLVQSLLWHSDRHLDGFWAAPGERSHFWFEQVVDESLAGAARISRQSRLGADRPIADRRARSDQLAQAGLQIMLASAERIRFGYVGGRQPCVIDVATAGGEVPPGQAALWLISARPQAVEIDANGRGVVTSGGSTTFDLLRSSRDDDDENCDPFEIQPIALFRGHQWLAGSNLTIEPCRAPGRIVAIEPAAPTGAVEVQGRDQRAVVFVLDCSLSMNEDLAGVQGGKPSKFDVALENLKSIIARMDASNRVGLVAFGHRVAYDKSAGNAKRFNSDWERRVKNRPIPADTTPWNDFEELIPVDQLKNNRPTFTTWLDDLGPFGNTPLVGAMALATESLPSVGGGTIVAITDGEDSMQDNYSQYVKDVRAAIDKGRANVFVVGFKIQNTGPLDQMAKTLGCKFSNADDAKELLDAVNEAIQPRPYSLLARSTGQVLEERDIGQSIDDLKPGEYQLAFGEFTPLPIEIFGGERLQFELNHATRRFQRIRSPYNQRENAVDVGDAGDGRPTFLACQNFTLEADAARLTLLLSNDNRDASVNRPQDVLFEIRPNGSSERPTAVRQRPTPGAAEPTWDLELSGWPQRRSAEVRAWWKMEHTPPDVRLSLADVRAAGDAASALKLELPGAADAVRLISRSPGGNRLQVSVFPKDVSASTPDERALIEDVRVEIGTEDVRNEFHPLRIAVSSDYSDSDGTKIFDLTIPPGTDESKLVLGVTTEASRKRDAIQTAKPLVISK